jgi:hypothetical protein
MYDLLMKKNCALQELDLSWQRLSKASKNCSILKLARLTSALAGGNNSLQSLNISDNRLLDQDVAELAVALTRNASMKRIHMQNCRITTRGMLALVQTIPHWSDSFKSLYLDGTQRVEKSSRMRKTIYQALLENFHLHVLTLPSSCQSKRIEWVLDVNLAGRRVLLNPTQMEETDESSSSSNCIESIPPNSTSDQLIIQDALWPTILERADRISRQHCCLEEMPANRAASAMFLLLREKGYQAISR